MIFFKKKNKQLPQFWANYLNLFKSQSAASDLNNDTRFIVFDTETTGLNPKKDTLLSIGAIGIRKGTIEVNDRFERFINYEEQSYDRKKQATISIHGIIPSHPDGQAVEKVIPPFVEYIGDSILVGQNIGFDVEMINQNLKRAGVNQKLKNHVLDTALMAMRLDGIRHPAHARQGKYNLDTLCNRFHIPMHDRHNAAGDAFITALLFLILSKKLQQKKINIQRELLGKSL